jgi:4a-hydroxytetrahydrobiopterin dehydratase
MITALRRKSCIPYLKGTPPLSETAENELLPQLDSWTLDRSGEHRLTKRFDFHSFVEAIGFVNTLAMITEEERHHPSIRIDYRTVSIELYTHSIRGLSENDFIMAAKTDALYSLVTEPANGILESVAW